MSTFSKIKSTNKKNIWVQIQINFKKYGHKKKLIYGYKLKLKRKLVQIKNGYKLKLKMYVLTLKTTSLRGAQAE